MTALLLIIISFLLLAAMAAEMIFVRKIKNRTLEFTGVFFLSAWLVNIAAELCGQPEGSALDVIFGSMIGVLQSFSLDASYGEIITALQNIPVFQSVIHVYASILLMVAPIVGGAAVLTIISDIFPIVKYTIRSFFRKNIYIFSCLNDQTCRIAEYMISNHEVGKSSLIVFAGTWAEEDNEETANRIGRAKMLGALCLKEDMTSLYIPRGKHVTCFMAREDDMRNIDDAVYLAGAKGVRQWKNAKNLFIYVYSQSDMAPKILEQIYRGLDAETADKLKLTIVPYKTNTVYRLLMEQPLYRYLDPDPQKEEELSVVIAGNDEFAEEIYRAVFWCGQIPHKQLRIISVSDDGEGFSSRMHYLMPEMDVVDSDKPYCITEFLTMAPDSSEFAAFMASETAKKVNVWFVTEGDDRVNMETAAFIERKYNAVHLLNPKKSVVHYQITSDELMHMLNNSSAAADNRCQAHAFASGGEQYSMENVWDDLHEFAWMLDDAWSGKALDQTAATEYRRRSSLASALHLQYKLYTFGLLKNDEDNSWTSIRNGLMAYIRAKDFQQKNDYAIGYLEHRRWNAYIRSLGYTRVSMDDWEAYYKTPEGLAKKAKDGRIDSKINEWNLHTCLVEYRPKPSELFEFLPEDRNQWNSTEIRAAEAEGKLDELDELSIRLYRMGEGLKKRAGDMKTWDTLPMRFASDKFFVYDMIRTVLKEQNPNCAVHYFTELKDVLAPGMDALNLLQTVVNRLEKELPEQNREVLARNLEELKKEPERLKNVSVKEAAMRLTR